MSKVDWTAINPVWDRFNKVIAAWVFGSSQDGEVRPGSDVDIGILFTIKPTLDELLTLRGDLQSALHIEDIDLVILNHANPYLRFEAIRGKSLFCRDLSLRAEFVSLTAREYEDEAAFLEKGLRSLEL